MGIKSAALVFQELLDYEYKIKIVQNRHKKPIDLVLRFDESNFHHLCGIHYLADLKTRYENSSLVFKKILSDKYTDEMFTQSKDYDYIKSRVECLENLKNILENNNSTIFKYNSSQRRNTKIDFDFLIKQLDDNGKSYYFVIKDKKEKGTYVGCSCFGRTFADDDYAKGHTAYYILQKTKINIKTKEEEQLYIAPSYKKQLESESSTAARESETNIKKIEFSPLPDAPSVALARNHSQTAFSISGLWRKIKTSIHSLFPKQKQSLPESTPNRKSQVAKSIVQDPSPKDDSPKQPAQKAAPFSRAALQKSAQAIHEDERQNLHEKEKEKSKNEISL